MNFETAEAHEVLLHPGGTVDWEKIRKHHWREYFLALRRHDAEQAKHHREIAEDLEAERTAINAQIQINSRENDQLEAQLRGPSRTPLINREHFRQFLLDTAKQNRAHKFTRVSEQTLRLANHVLRQWAIGHVNRMPSKGKTL